MHLNEQQIQQLFDFTRQHYVEYYDVQAELVDHLANAIEEAMTENPKLNFEQALQAEFKKFGIFGFMDVIESRQKALGRKYHKIVLKETAGVLCSPKLILILAAAYLCYYALIHVSMGNEIYLVFFSLTILVNIFLSNRDRRKNNRKDKTHKKLLFKEMINGYGNAAMIFVIPVQIISNIWNSESTVNNIFLSTILSVLIVLYCLFTYVLRVTIPSKADMYLRETYPGYEFGV